MTSNAKTLDTFGVAKSPAEKKKCKKLNPIALCKEQDLSMLSYEDLNQMYHEVKILFASILMRNPIKSCMQSLTTRKIYDLFYEVIYKYSHKKLSKLMKVGCFRLVFQKFTATGALEEMLSLDPTLTANLDVYRERSERLIQE